MGKSLNRALIVGVILTVAVASRLAAQPNSSSPPSAAEATIRTLVDSYMRSIDDADPKLGAAVWSPTPDVSFIEPTGHERGWDQIASVVYGKLMGQAFSQRTLKNVGDVSVRIHGDAAVVEFDWDFVAVVGANGRAVHTTGRESEVYMKLPNVGWRLVHIHYSGPPVRDSDAGF